MDEKDTLEIEIPLLVEMRNRKDIVMKTSLEFELETTISHIVTKNNIAEQNIRNRDNLAIMASAIESVAEFFGISLLDLK